MAIDAFTEALLQVMERKTHWAWPLFTSGQVKKDKLHIHLEQEYEVYVRDFPVLIGNAYVQCPVPEVRRDLAENLYEEETGGIAAGRPHPELFLEYPKGLGFDLARFDKVTLLPAAKAYRAFLDDATRHRGWEAALCVTTIFIEGTPFDRGEIDGSAPKRPAPPLAEHPLVKHYGLDIEHLALTKAHRNVEGEHRAAAWRMASGFIKGDAQQRSVGTLEEALVHWLRYRDDVAKACGLSRDDAPAP